MDKNKKLFFAIILAIAMMSFVSAEYGCCYDANVGSCAKNTEYSSCSGSGISFYASTTCSVSSCIKGCCVLGTSTVYSTPRECEILSQQGGFSYPGSFSSSDEQGCYNLGRTQVEGACVYGSGVTKSCTYTTYGQCGSAEFHDNTLCSAVPNVSCNVTGNTMCGIDENVHYKDSCGNQDAQKEVCDYNSGKICTTRNSTSAYCKDLNCPGLNNGDSRCIDIWTALGHEVGTASPVGSRFYRQYCLNGEVFTEPCADFRAETCEESGSNANCEINKWSDCADANNDKIDEASGSKVDGEKCDEEYCYVWNRFVTETAEGIGAFYYDPSINMYTTTPNDPATATQYGISDPLLTDLHMEMCVPDVPGGLQFYDSTGSSGSSTSAEDVCEKGNYEATLYLTDPGSYRHSFTSGNTLTAGYASGWVLGHYDYDSEKWDQDYINGEDKWGYAAILTINISEWDASKDGYYLAPRGKNPLYGLTGTASEAAAALNALTNAAPSEKIPNKWFTLLLKNRCLSLGDCAPNVNWLESSGSSSSSSGFSCKKDGNDHKIKCTFSFECVPFESPDGGSDCAKCGKDDLQCSEYRCMSLGDCAYEEPDGVGYCIPSNDYEAPQISCETCPTELLPYTGALFTIKTNEFAKCKFNLNNAGAKFDDMDYDFGQGYNLTHSVVLNLPGQVSGINASELGADEYDLITDDGNYTLYVRCEDVAGNGEASAPYTIKFHVLQEPDTTAPFLSSFLPVSGSAIAYNTTQKTISFQMNEPAECKWSLTDIGYDLMTNSFNCDTSLSASGVLNDYSCSGILTNVTLNLSQQTQYYIKCEDQPWLEGHEYNLSSTLIYKRNKHNSQNDYSYILRPSEKLQITDITPRGTISKPSSNTSFELEARTSGGGAGGVAECWWKLNTVNDFSSGTLTRFFNTVSNYHKQTITNRSESQYYANVKCSDTAGNNAEANGTFFLDVDDSSPILTRILYKAGQLLVDTNENAMCVFSLDTAHGCFFDYLNNGTSMNGIDKQHTTSWLYDKAYYIICKDYQGNYNNGCLASARTY